jgi:Protein of unknown function (DUF4038)/Putative collagen-binding domain of a collagenase
VYDTGDFRPVWRSLAEGLVRGTTGQAVAWNQTHSAWNQLFMTYQATRRDNPGSSIWFHEDPWLDMNGIQVEYHSVTGKVASDWKKLPPKPAMIIETRYEDDMSTDGKFFAGAFKQRYQMYHAVLSGAAAYSYGHSRVWDFSTTDKTWRVASEDPGRRAMKTLWQLFGTFSDAQLRDRVPDVLLIDGSLGSGPNETLLVAMRGGDRRFALVYSTNGRDIRLKTSQLAAGTGDAYWFSPRDGKYYNSAGTQITGKFASVATGSGTPIAVFNPPGTAGADNDWILIVRVR